MVKKQRIGSMFGQRGTDAKPFTTNAQCSGSGMPALVGAVTFARCPRCLRRILVTKSGVLRAHIG